MTCSSVARIAAIDSAFADSVVPMPECPGGSCERTASSRRAMSSVKPQTLAGTPPAIIARLHGETLGSLKAPEVRDFMIGEGAELVGSNPAELAAYLKREIERYGKVIKAANIKLD